MKEKKKAATAMEKAVSEEASVAEEVTAAEQDMDTCCCLSGKHKERDEAEIKALKNRLNRIEGQIRGIKGMLEDGAYCTDILIQSQAAASAINSFNKELLSNHIHTCVADHIRNGDDEVIDELITTLHKLMK